LAQSKSETQALHNTKKYTGNGRQEIMVNTERLVNEFLHLVRIDSETGNERAMCDYLTTLFTGLGGVVQEDESTSHTGLGSGNLYVWLPGTVEGRSPFLLSCHMDTVRPGNQIQPRIDSDGYIRSDGTTILGSDDKAGIAAVIEAVRMAKEHGYRNGPVELLFSAGEESGMVGMKHCTLPLQSRYGFVLDASGPVGKINISESAKVTMNVEVTGKAAHSTMPESGVNAVIALMRALSACRFGRLDEITVSNVGLIEGGTAVNIVPDHAKAVIEVRSLSQEKLNQELADIRRTVEEIVQAAGAAVAFTLIPSCDAYRIPEEAPVLRHTRKAISRIGRKPTLSDNMGCSDANILNALGIPAVKLSIGYEQIHSVREQMPIAELEKAAELAFYLMMEDES
jgi:tripeptide aminopeptidase